MCNTSMHITYMYNNYACTLIIILTFHFSTRSINISRHIISGCDNSRVYFQMLKRAKIVACIALSHILITHENTFSTGSSKYLHTIDDIRISISYVKCRQGVPKGG